MGEIIIDNNICPRVLLSTSLGSSSAKISSTVNPVTSLSLAQVMALSIIFSFFLPPPSPLEEADEEDEEDEDNDELLVELRELLDEEAIVCFDAWPFLRFCAALDIPRGSEGVGIILQILFALFLTYFLFL